MKTGDVKEMTEGVLEEWLDGSYFEQDEVLAAYLEQPISQKVQLLGESKYGGLLFQNRETGQRFRVMIAVYEEDSDG